MTSLDLIGQPSIQETYFIHQAQAGVWQLKLSGEPAPADTYVVSAIGANPAPGISDMTATAQGDTDAVVSWRLTSDEPTTVVSLYANPGPITTTEVITGSGGVTQTVEVPYYAGTLLETNIATPLDGSVFTTTVSLDELSSGVYHLWVEAEDGVNPPVRAYAYTPMTVNQLGSWSPTWSPVITFTSRYGGMDLAWSEHTHPDVDGYVVYMGTSPLSPTTAISVGNTTETPLASLNPGETYDMVIVAYDEASGLTSTSQTFTTSTGVAAFALSAAPSSATLVGGQEAIVVVTITTPLDPYPDAVGLYPEAGHDGITLLPESDVVTPTIAGIAVPVVVSTTNAVPDGLYTALLTATGGGMTQTLSFPVTVHEPGFTVEHAPAVPILSATSAVAITVTTQAAYGDDRLISFSLEDLPGGLLWGFSDSSVMPGQATTLILTDTEILATGVHTLTLIAENGVRVVSHPIVLTVEKAAFTVETVPARVIMRQGEERTVRLRAIGQAGWTGAVTLTLDAATVPAGMTIGFVVDDATRDSIVLEMGQEALLRIGVAPDAAGGLSRVRLVAESGGLLQDVMVGVQVGGSQVYWPTIMSGWRPPAP